jgi:hypothetical protein
MKPTDKTSTAEKVARAFFGAGDDPASVRRAVRRWLGAAASAAVLVPAIFYLYFGRLDGFAWGVTVFLVVYCLLSAVGLYFLRRPAYHTPVALRGDWRDRIGAFWLMACGFGPFFGWLTTNAVPLTLGNWRWLYAARVVLSIAFPVITALALLRYVRGRGAVVMLALLLGVTALPVWSAWPALQDLVSGPQSQQAQAASPKDSKSEFYLPHTHQELPNP